MTRAEADFQIDEFEIPDHAEEHVAGNAVIAGETCASPHAGKQQVNTGEPPVRVCFCNSAAVRDEAIGFRLINRAKVAFRHIDGTD